SEPCLATYLLSRSLAVPSRRHHTLYLLTLHSAPASHDLEHCAPNASNAPLVGVHAISWMDGRPFAHARSVNSMPGTRQKPAHSAGSYSARYAGTLMRQKRNEG